MFVMTNRPRRIHCGMYQDLALLFLDTGKATGIKMSSDGNN